MDALTEVLQTMPLHSCFLGRAELSAPWGIRVDSLPHAAFHVVTRGNCWLDVDNLPQSIPLTSGDLVVIPQGHGHSLRYDLNSPVLMLEEVLAMRPSDSQNVLHFGGGGIATTLVCGYFYFDDWGYNPLLAALSPLILIKGEDGRAVEWLDTTLQFITCETASNRPGAQTVITRLCDVLFIQAVRAFIANLKDCDRSWLRALKDPNIGLAVGLIHRYPETSWTVASLATRVCMSRSAFAANFKNLVGEPPLHYLTRVRMHKAISLLRSSRDNLKQIAQQVGYESEAAFSNAFKRSMGKSPGEYRRIINQT